MSELEQKYLSLMMASEAAVNQKEARRLINAATKVMEQINLKKESKIDIDHR